MRTAALLASPSRRHGSLHAPLRTVSGNSKFAIFRTPSPNSTRKLMNRRVLRRVPWRNPRLRPNNRFSGASLSFGVPIPSEGVRPFPPFTLGPKSGPTHPRYKVAIQRLRLPRVNASYVAFHTRVRNLSATDRRARSSARRCASRLTVRSSTLVTTPSRMTKRPSIITEHVSCPRAE